VSFDKHNIKTFDKGFSIKNLNFSEVLNHTAVSLQNNKIVGWYQGRSEFRPGHWVIDPYL